MRLTLSFEEEEGIDKEVILGNSHQGVIKLYIH